MDNEKTTQRVEPPRLSILKSVPGGCLVFCGMACLMNFSSGTLFEYLLPDAMFFQFLPRPVVSLWIGILGIPVAFVFVACQMAVVHRSLAREVPERWLPFVSATMLLLPFLVLVLWFEISGIVNLVATYRDQHVFGVPDAVARHVSLGGFDLMFRSVAINVCTLLVPGYVTTYWLIAK